MFSIVIPTYNRGKLIGNTIKSIIDQTYSNFEVLIIDDGGTDDTKEVIDKFNDPRLRYFHKQNEERGVARNFGMSHAHGDYITFVDSDDSFYPHHLQHAYSKLSEFKNPEFYRQAFEVKNEAGKVLFANNKLRGDANKFILKGNYFSCIGVFLKKEITSINSFSDDKFLCTSEDWEYWLRLSVRYKFFYDNRITAFMLEHDQRSMNIFNEKKKRLSISILINCLRRDKVFMDAHGLYLNQIKAHMYSLLCLGKVLNKMNEGLLNDLIKTYKLSKTELFSRRGLAIAKYYIFNLTKSF